MPQDDFDSASASRTAQTDGRDQPYDELPEGDVREPLGGGASPADEVRPATEPPAGGDAARERDEYRDLLLRKTAEFDNYRKRVERERRELSDLAAADVLNELLPIVDDFERALRADVSEESAEAYRRGVEIIHRQLVELLRKRGVRPIVTVGADFDPRVHEAVVHEVSPDHRDGEIVDELRRGYMLGDRLLRPAMVKVAKA